MTSGDGVERERKFAGWVGFELPPLDDVEDGVAAVPLPEQNLEATYYDTPSLALARMGVTLRYRTGDDDGDLWTLKLPTKGARKAGLGSATIPASASTCSNISSLLICLGDRPASARRVSPSCRPSKR